MPLQLDTTFEQDALSYGVTRRRWSCPLGHTVWQDVARASTMSDRPIESMIPSGTRCLVCHRPLRQDSGREYHRFCLKKDRAKKLYARLHNALDRLTPRPCASCGMTFQPTTFRHVYCYECRRWRTCPVCRIKHRKHAAHKEDV